MIADLTLVTICTCIFVWFILVMFDIKKSWAGSVFNRPVGNIRHCVFENLERLGLQAEMLNI